MKQIERMSTEQTTTIGPVQATRLRQIALVAQNLKESERILTKVFGVPTVYRDPHVERWGLKNILLCLGGDCLEVVSPFQQGTTGGRLLEKRGDGGYMVIMQTEDAALRRDYILKNKLASVITDSRSSVHQLVQYHPKGVKGGVMPELDSHSATEAYPNPVTAEFSPWLALGPPERAPLYLAAMRHCSYLRLIGVVLRLEPNDTDTLAAAKQWEETFGVKRRGELLCFTNSRMGFVAGAKEKAPGIHSITVAVEGKERMDRMLWAAQEEGLCGDGWIDMIGIKWYFVEAREAASKGL